MYVKGYPSIFDTLTKLDFGNSFNYFVHRKSESFV